MGAVANLVRVGIQDADQEARKFARAAFWSLHRLFPSHADSLRQQLDPKTVKLLLSNKEHDEQFGSTNSLNEVGLGFDYVESVASQPVAAQSTASRYKQVPSSGYATPSARMKRSTSASEVKNSRSNSVISTCCSILLNANLSLPPRPSPPHLSNHWKRVTYTLSTHRIYRDTEQ